MTTKLVPANTLQKGRFIVIDGVACRVASTQTSRPGKHGHAKIRIEAMGLFDNRRREIVVPGHDNVDTPVIEKRNAQVLYLHEGKANVMDVESNEIFDMPIPDDMKDQVKDGAVILYWNILGEKVMKQLKSEGED